MNSAPRAAAIVCGLIAIALAVCALTILAVAAGVAFIGERLDPKRRSTVAEAAEKAKPRMLQIPRPTGPQLIIDREGNA